MQQYFLAYLRTYLLKGEMLWDPSKARRCAASCSRPVGIDLRRGFSAVCGSAAQLREKLNFYIHIWALLHSFAALHVHANKT